ncbi:MAG: hypothetical protein ACYCZY_07905 [Lacisediminihabitans sp.]
MSAGCDDAFDRKGEGVSGGQLSIDLIGLADATDAAQGDFLVRAATPGKRYRGADYSPQWARRRHRFENYTRIPCTMSVASSS